MARVQIRRHITADPASVALLLAEPARETDQNDIVVTPPRRAGVGFTSTFQVTSPAGRLAGGTITVEPSVDAGADLVLTVRYTEDSRARTVERSVTAYAARLASRARFRAFAA